MSDDQKLKPCPACEHLRQWAGAYFYMDGQGVLAGQKIKCVRQDFLLAEIKKAEPKCRNDAPAPSPGDGARLRKLRDYVRGLTIYGVDRYIAGQPVTARGDFYTQREDAVIRSHVLDCIDAALAEPEPAAVAPVAVPAETLEALASLEHDQWVAWSKNIAENETITAERRERWVKLWRPYDRLTETEKDQDREWARKVLAVCRLALSLPTAPQAAAPAEAGELERPRAEADELHEAKHELIKELQERPTGEEFDKLRAECESLRKERDELRHGAEACCEKPSTCTEKCAWRECDQLRAALRTLAREYARGGGGG